MRRYSVYTEGRMAVVYCKGNTENSPCANGTDTDFYCRWVKHMLTKANFFKKSSRMAKDQLLFFV